MSSHFFVHFFFAELKFLIFVNFYVKRRETGFEGVEGFLLEAFFPLICTVHTINNK